MVRMDLESRIFGSQDWATMPPQYHKPRISRKLLYYMYMYVKTVAYVSATTAYNSVKTPMRKTIN